MPGELNIALSTETLDSGPPEEAAAFGVFAITANDRLLTAGEDTATAELRHGPRVSGYPVAEWIAWNWWRLRWEGESPADRAAAREWSFAHRMSAIGGGYAWPGVEIVSDGRQCFLRSEPTPDAGAVLFRYIGADRRVLVSAEAFEAAIDGFLNEVAGRLEGRGLRDTNLHRLLSDLGTERADPALARFRRLEARLGLDPDEIDADEIHRRLADAPELGEEALEEVAADTASRGAGPERMMSAADFASAAARSGFDVDWRDAAAPGGVEDVSPPGPAAPAWRVGKGMARRIRDRAGLANGGPVSNARLAELAGTTEDAITRNRRCADGMAFALRGRGAGGRLALRSKWATGRRFELARLAGDRLFASLTGCAAENLFPATRAYSYRQKAQRAFAAELLSPFDAVDDMLRDDYSEDSQRKAARRFDVSEMTIQTALVNHRRLARDEEAPSIMDRGSTA